MGKQNARRVKQFKYLNLNIYSMKVKKYVLQIWISFIYPFFYVTLKLIVVSY